MMKIPYKKGSKNSLLMIFGSIIAVSIILVFVFWLVASAIFGLAPAKKNQMARKYNKEKTELTMVVEYAENNNFYFNDNDLGDLPKDSISQSKDIEKTLFEESIVKLFEKYGYDLIYTENNGVYFQYWANMDYGRGLVYSLDGKKPTPSGYLTVIEPIGEKNWYFYESSYKPNKVFGPY